jgi:hypothetical protein
VTQGLWVERQWSSVRAGDYVQNVADGTAWQVIARGVLGDITVRNQQMSQANIGKQSGPVAVWDGSPEALNLEGFRAVLGAKVIYDKKS